MARKGENIYKRKDGRWEGRYKLGYDDSGKTKYRSVYGRSYQAVKEKLCKLKAEPKFDNDSGSLTVQMLFEEWLTNVRLRVKESTCANYQLKFNKHILPEFGGKRYSSLTAKMLNCFIESKLKSGLSAKYVSDIVVVFMSMSKYVSSVHRFYNPISEVTLPKTAKREMPLYDELQQKKLCKYLINNMNPTSLCVLLSLYTGLRIGEICGLKWSDVELEKSILTVKRTVQRISNPNGKGTKLVITSPKSRTSERSIPIPKFLTAFLKERYNASDNYVLSASDTVIEPRTLQYRFKALLKKANLPSINFHALRHTFATNCIKAGFDVKTLSEILGHSSVETTLNLYVHSSMERKIECMNMLVPAA